MADDDATCPFPTCPVADPADVDLRRLRTMRLAAGEQFFSVFSSRHAGELFNRSGAGSTRFAPLFSAGGPIGTAYLARTETAALLETLFHEIQPFGVASISRSVDLHGRGIREVEVANSDGLRLIDLRDGELDRLGMQRDQLVSTSPAHYGCTRRWARTLREKKPVANGIIWSSRVAEVASDRSTLHRDLQRSNYADVLVLFNDRTPDADLRHRTVAADLNDPAAIDLIETIADNLGAVIV